MPIIRAISKTVRVWFLPAEPINTKSELASVVSEEAVNSSWAVMLQIACETLNKLFRTGGT